MKKALVLQITVALSYLAMITVNALANILPINGIPTGTVSDNYANLFAPAGYTFSIWGLIYLLLAVYTVYQFIAWKKKTSASRSKLFGNIAIYFSLSSLINIAWLFAWHYDYMGHTVLLMAALLLVLIKINNIIKQEDLKTKERLLIALPFSVYLGWITVATIANITTFLVSINWNGFGLSESIWTIAILLAGVAIGTIRSWQKRDVAYGLVLVWAYIGILVKHQTFYNGEYRAIITTLIFSLAFLMAILTNIFLINRSNKKAF